MMSPSDDSTSNPPPPNPLQTAYEDFIRKTPFVTRTLVHVLAVSYAISWLWDTYFALANIPQFTIGRFEIYRLFTSFLVNDRLSTLIFAALGFIQQGKRLEESIGSTSFCYHCLFLGILSNTLYTATSYGLQWASKDVSSLSNGTAGLWQVLFGIIATECVVAPRMSRPFLFCKVPSLYYPVVLYALIVFVGQGNALGYLFSLGLGYLSGFGKLNRIKLSATRINNLEAGQLLHWTRKPGWIKEEEMLGDGAWSKSDEESTGLSLPTRITQAGVYEEAGQNPGGDARLTLPNGEGRTLGSSRRSVDPRTARLQALERTT